MLPLSTELRGCPAHAGSGRSDPLEVARRLVPVLEAESSLVDARGVFPERALAELRRSGLMGLLVPEQYGGMGGSYLTMSQIARMFGEACMSTSLIWGMHCQQVAVMVHHASEELRCETLPQVAVGSTYVASVTTERGKGGHLLTAVAPLEFDRDGIILQRQAPVVTGGAQADAFLITMRSSSAAPLSDVQLVWATRDRLQVSVSGSWEAMGARGTQSVALNLDGHLPRGHVVGANGFREVALTTMVPVGHIAWASSWLGAAAGVFRKMVAFLRDPSKRASYDVTSELFATRVAEIRSELGMVSAYLNQTILTYEALRRRGNQSLADYETPAFQIQVNDLKLIASKRLFRAVDKLLELAGLRHGYLKNAALPLERVFRDLCSARLMYSNERLLVANGKLALLDREVTLP